MICKICANDNNNTRYVVREMMFGLREEFEYSQCSNCACLQLENVPADMSKYYPAQYYSFISPEVFTKNSYDNLLVRFLRQERTDYLLGKKNILGRLIALIKPAEDELAQYLGLLKKCNGGLDSKILDVGCGKGKTIAELSWYGFKNLVGIDPYIDADILNQKNVKVYKSDIYSLGGTFDIILLSHSFEHMNEPLRVLLRLEQLLAAKGHIIIRIPTVSSYAWQRYRANWVGVDAPRHLFLYSLESMEMLSAQAGLRIKEIIFDSTEFQFWASAQYEQDIPLYGERSFKTNPKSSIFSNKDMAIFLQKAKELNQERMGDQVSIFLTKSEVKQ